MSEVLLCVNNLRVAYPKHHDTWVVDNVSFELKAGEKLGLVGESGCGKSTIGRALLNLLPSGSKIEGDITYQGESIFDYNPTSLRRFRGEVVGLVFQDPMTRLDPLMTIAEHCVETLRAHHQGLSRKQAQQQAMATLEAVKIPSSRGRQYPHEFSGGMRQRVAIALALLLNPKIIVADEPTTSLDVTVAGEILQELKRLCDERQMSLLIISHDLAMIGAYSNSLAVMYRGELVETGPTPQVFTSPEHPYTQALLTSAFHIRKVKPNIPDIHDKTKPLLKVSNLKKYYTLESNLLENIFSKTPSKLIKAVDDVDLTLYPGETFGLVGESGCGKSTLSRTILQLISATSGRVEFLSQDLTQLSSAQMRPYRRELQLIFQDPHACLNPLMTVGDNIAEPLLIHQLLTPIEVRKKVKEMLEQVQLIPVNDYYARYPKQLSGGQQQRVAIARALITQPKLVICDEPVSMLDATVQAEVLRLMEELKVQFNLTYLFITHDLWLAKYFCDRLAVMYEGKIIETGNTQDLFANPVQSYTKKLLNSSSFDNFTNTP